jgi:hypothetical protein
LQGQRFVPELSVMERETGIEPATFSLGNRPSIENNEHSVSGHLVLATGITENLSFALSRIRMEHKWSTQTLEVPGVPQSIALRNFRSFAGGANN